MTASWSPVGDGDVRVGLIGLGSMGRNHLRILASMEGARLVAVADPDATALAAATDATGALGFAEPLALLAEADLDAVVIAAPTTTHVGLALAAIDRGIAALIEKPLAATPPEAEAIVAASLATGVPVQVGHVERFNPAVLELGRACPSLVGTVLRDGLVHPAYKLSLNGERFVDEPATALDDGDVLLLLAADVGG